MDSDSSSGTGTEVGGNSKPPLFETEAVEKKTKKALKKRNIDKRGRSWVFTINNFSKLHILWLLAYPFKQCIIGFEDCVKDVDEPSGWKSIEGKTRHLQGCFEVKNTRWNAVRTLMSPLKWSWFDTMKGDWSDQSYCGKDGCLLRMEKNEGAQGSRKDLERLYDAVRAGQSNYDIVTSADLTNVWMKHYKACAALQQVVSNRNNLKFNKPNVHIRWGDAGAGKTSFFFARAENENIQMYVMEDPAKGWFCGYEDQKALLIDDFQGAEEIAYGKFLRMTDGYPRILQVKGGSVQSRWTEVWITSNVHPKHWYPQGMTAALARRITSVVEVKSDEEIVCPDMEDGEIDDSAFYFGSQ